MKIEATVCGVVDHLETLEVSMKGWPTTAKEGTFATPYKIDIPATERARKAFHLGRRVNISIDPA